MRIVDVTKRFAKLENRSGCGMRSVWDKENQTMQLYYTNSRNPIAEIYDYKDSKNFRLRIHNKQKYCGRMEHINRVNATLRSIQMPDDKSDWENFRYSGFISYYLKVHDRKLGTEYKLEDRPIEFQFKDGRLVIDYAQLESGAFPNEPTPIITELNANSNLQSVSSRLTTILQGV